MVFSFNNLVNNLPNSLLEDRDIFKNVINKDILEKIPKDKLMTIINKHLPSELNSEEKLQTVNDLFDDNLNFFTINQMDNFYKQAKIQKFQPDLIKHLNELKVLKKKAYLLEEKKLQCKLLKEILVKKKLLMEKVLNSPPPNENEFSIIDSNKLESEIEKNIKLDKVDYRFSKEIKKLNSSLSSSDEDVLNNKNIYQKEYSVNKLEYIKLLKNFKRKKSKKNIDDEYFKELSIKNVFSRVFSDNSDTDNYSDIPVRIKKKKLKKTNEYESTKDKDVDNKQDISQNKNNTKNNNALIKSKELNQNVGSPSNNSLKENEQKASNTVVCYGKPPASFFSLIRDIFYNNSFNELKLTLSKLEELVKEKLRQFDPKLGWQSDLVQSAMNYLSGALPPPKMIPLVDYKEKNQQWQWIGNDCDDDQILIDLYNEWMNELNRYSLSDPTKPVPPSICPTEWTVKESTIEEKLSYREQEILRYRNPNKSFTFYLHGYKSVVGPVKGCTFFKESLQFSSLAKPKERTLLLKERPPFVTLLSLVRDSAARLPNGEGTRADICELLKDSQFLMDDISEEQISAIVSGALDRLHYEKDPCVRYDLNRKVWVYLHRYRSEEDFNRLHKMQIEAHLAKKNLNKVPKKNCSSTGSVSQSNTKKKDQNKTEDKKIKTNGLKKNLNNSLIKPADLNDNIKNQNSIPIPIKLNNLNNDQPFIEKKDPITINDSTIKKETKKKLSSKKTVKTSLLKIKSKINDDKNLSTINPTSKTDLTNKTNKPKFQKKTKKLKQTSCLTDSINEISIQTDQTKDFNESCILTNDLNKNTNFFRPSLKIANFKETDVNKVVVQNSANRINLPTNVILNSSNGSLILSPSNNLNAFASFTMLKNGNQIVIHPQNTAINNLSLENKLLSTSPNSLSVRTIQGIRVVPLTNNVQQNQTSLTKSSPVVAKLISSSNSLPKTRADISNQVSITSNFNQTSSKSINTCPTKFQKISKKI